LHRLDPRTKLALGVLTAVALFLLAQPGSLVLLALVLLLMAARAGVGVRFFILGLGPLAPILLVTLAYHWWLGDPLRGAVFCLRMMDLLLVTSLYSLTTSPIAMCDGLESLLSPLARVGLPAHELALVFSIALRFVPTLALEAERIAKAQMARGAPLDHGGPFTRARAFTSVLVPLFVRAFRYADELAVAMEARGYRPGAGRTRLRQLKPGWADLGMVVATGVALWGLLAL